MFSIHYLKNSTPFARFSLNVNLVLFLSLSLSSEEDRIYMQYLLTKDVNDVTLQSLIVGGRLINGSEWKKWVL